MAQQTHTPDALPPGHVPLPVVLTGSMGMALAIGLHLFGLLDTLDRHLTGIVAGEDAVALTPAMSGTVLWIATAAVAYGLALVVLEIPGNWRRVVIWVSAMVVIAGWLPVAAIANAHAPVAAPLVAAAWAGLCSLIYAARHHMEADDEPTLEIETSDSSDATD